MLIWESASLICCFTLFCWLWFWLILLCVSLTLFWASSTCAWVTEELVTCAWVVWVWVACVWVVEGLSTCVLVAEELAACSWVVWTWVAEELVACVLSWFGLIPLSSLAVVAGWLSVTVSACTLLAVTKLAVALDQVRAQKENA